MKSGNKGVIRFEMSQITKFIFYKCFFICYWSSLAVFGFLIIHGIMAKYSLLYILEGTAYLCGGVSVLFLLTIWRIRRGRFASELNIDEQKEDFSVYIYDIKKEVRFKVDDIAEVASSSEMFRFYLKDGTWISWVKEEIHQQYLEEIIKSLGIVVQNKKLW